MYAVKNNGDGNRFSPLADKSNQTIKKMSFFGASQRTGNVKPSSTPLDVPPRTRAASLHEAPKTLKAKDEDAPILLCGSPIETTPRGVETLSDNESVHAAPDKSSTVTQPRTRAASLHEAPKTLKAKDEDAPIYSVVVRYNTRKQQHEREIDRPVSLMERFKQQWQAQSNRIVDIHIGEDGGSLKILGTGFSFLKLPHAGWSFELTVLGFGFRVNRNGFSLRGPFSTRDDKPEPPKQHKQLEIGVVDSLKKKNPGLASVNALKIGIMRTQDADDPGLTHAHLVLNIMGISCTIGRSVLHFSILGFGLGYTANEYCSEFCGWTTGKLNFTAPKWWRVGLGFIGKKGVF